MILPVRSRGFPAPCPRRPPASYTFNLHILLLLAILDRDFHRLDQASGDRARSGHPGLRAAVR